MRRALVAFVLAVLVSLTSMAVVGAQDSSPVAVDPDVPEGCFVTSHVYEGDQFGDTFAVTVEFNDTQPPPFDVHVVVTAQPGYWLMKVKGGWIGPNGVEGIEWINPDGVANRSYEFDAYGGGIGIRGIACSYPCLATPPTLPGTPGTSLPEPPCYVPPTTMLEAGQPPLPLMCPEGGEVLVGPQGPYCQMPQAVSVTSSTEMGVSEPAHAVQATPQFTG